MTTTDPDATLLRRHAEDENAAELVALAEADRGQPKPPGWNLSPRAVKTFLLGGTLPDGAPIRAKYIGREGLIEIAVATLATDRALLLYGVPGTGKSWVAEHLAAAISGDSTRLVQGTAGTDESAIRYGWNYALLLAEGPSRAALVPSPVMRAMEDGVMVRIEELTRVTSEVQDGLITILSEKALPIPELATEVQARRGFNVIATANNRDKGVNELSSALVRRFNTVAPSVEVERIVTIFRELRHGVTVDGQTRLKSPSGTLSTAEAISVLQSGLALAAYYGDGLLGAADVASALTGAIVKDPVQDRAVWEEYLATVAKERAGWRDLYRACRDVL
ncbi:MAG: ATPase [Deltaproteobacteria bacterium HGW-Deltaproteobacteria-14]|nr:MAG: ATPase [Deltaproteobacteria bacterium HGW-Deltaproteobacteria-14]